MNEKQFSRKKIKKMNKSWGERESIELNKVFFANNNLTSGADAIKKFTPSLGIPY